MCLISLWHLSSTGLGWRLKNAERLCVYFASPSTMSAGQSFLNRCWSCCACLSTFISKGKVDMLCSQSRSAGWSFKEKKQETTTNQKTTTKQVVLDTKWGTFHFLVFAFVLSWNALRSLNYFFLRARFMPWSPLESCFRSISIVQDDLIYTYIKSEYNFYFYF